MRNADRKFVTLAKDFHYTDMIGERVTIKTGRRFKVHYTHGPYIYNGNLVLTHHFGYGQAMVIPNAYLKNIKLLEK